MKTEDYKREWSGRRRISHDILGFYPRDNAPGRWPGGSVTYLLEMFDAVGPGNNERRYRGPTRNTCRNLDIMATNAEEVSSISWYLLSLYLRYFPNPYDR